MIVTGNAIIRAKTGIDPNVLDYDEWTETLACIQWLDEQEALAMKSNTTGDSNSVSIKKK